MLFVCYTDMYVKLISKVHRIVNKLYWSPSDCPVPFSIIFGGTDLNEHHKDKEKFETMSKVMERARYVTMLIRQHSSGASPFSAKTFL